MDVLAIRVLLAPGFVVFASLVARRFGARIGGVVAGLPMIAGPILLVLALQHGSTFASEAAVGVLLGMVGLAAFVLAYGATARWLSWRGAVVAAYTAFALAVVAMRPLSVGALPALIIACGSLVLTHGLLPRPPGADATLLAPARWDLPFRGVCTAAAVVTVTAVATTLGPHLAASSRRSRLSRPYFRLSRIRTGDATRQSGYCVASRSGSSRMPRSVLSSLRRFARSE